MSMKILAILAAGTLVASAMAPMAASANPAPQRWGHHTKWKTVCTTKWRNGHKWKQCRKVRVRR
jgi:Ni/Co efflux regulator RcnB